MSPPIYYEFGPFRLDPIRRSLHRDGERISMAAKPFDLLIGLIQHAGQPLSKEILMQAVWPDSKPSENTFNVTLSALRKALRESAKNPQYIVTTPEGYCFVGNVRVVQTESVEPEVIKLSEDQPTASLELEGLLSYKIDSPFGGHLWFVVLGCVLYAAYYAVSLVVEIAYQFDRYGRAALWIALGIFCGTFIASMGGLALDWKRTLQGRKDGVTVSILSFLIVAGLQFGLLCLFLPTYPITQAGFQTYTAQAAYFKDILYILPFSLVFLNVPVHFVFAMQRKLQMSKYGPVYNVLTGSRLGVLPRGAIYIKTWMLLLLLILMGAYFLAARARLLDNLMPSPYLNLFMNLIHVRLALYFALALVCLAWYSRALNELKRECLALCNRVS